MEGPGSTSASREGSRSWGREEKIKRQVRPPTLNKPMKLKSQNLSTNLLAEDVFPPHEVNVIGESDILKYECLRYLRI